jgi:hypothetical protein
MKAAAAATTPAFFNRLNDIEVASLLSRGLFLFLSASHDQRDRLTANTIEENGRFVSIDHLALGIDTPLVG